MKKASQIEADSNAVVVESLFNWLSTARNATCRNVEFNSFYASKPLCSHMVS